MQVSRFLKPHPTISIWNEVVATKPKSHAQEEAYTRALFYLSAPGMDAATLAFLKRAAQRNAATFGGKPVLVFDLASYLKGGDLFRCADGEHQSPALSDADFEAHVKAGTYARWYAGRRVNLNAAAARSWVDRPVDDHSIIPFNHSRVSR